MLVLLVPCAELEDCLGTVECFPVASALPKGELGWEAA